MVVNDQVLSSEPVRVVWVIELCLLEQAAYLPSSSALKTPLMAVVGGIECLEKQPWIKL